MNDLLFWLYLVNLSLLILHEMDSAYWKEWDLFGLGGGEGGFLLIHLPLWIAALYGAVQMWDKTHIGLIFSLIISLAGIAAFTIHSYFLVRGRPEFNAPVSKLILWALLILSLPQLAITIFRLVE
jgi:Family of unknown function (DUF6713)